MGCHKGCIPWNKGKTGCYSDETRKKISVALEGKKKPPRTAEQRKHYSDAQKKLWDDPGYRENQIIKGRARVISPEQRAAMIAHSKEATASPEYKLKMSETSRAQKDNPGRFHPGHKLTDEHKEVLRKRFAGENNPLWRGGISFEPYCPKFNLDLKRRIRAFFDHECVMCGKSSEESGEELSCHHVEYDKQACCDGKPVHFVALCRGCHTKTTVSLDRQRWENMLHIIIDEVYNGRSYYTKVEWSKMQ